MKKNTKVSVIIPVHNTPKDVLMECLLSIANQLFSDFEVIVVDDNSDNASTIDVLKYFEKFYSQIFKVDYENESVGAAESRNIGLSLATGKYCIFLDSDDFFSENLLEKTYHAICLDDSDVCVFGCKTFIDINKNREIIAVNKLEFSVDEIDSCEELFSLFPASGWNRLCKKEYLVNNKISFQSLKSDNDTFFSLATILLTKKIVYLNEPDLLYYRAGTDYQISRSMNPLNLDRAFNKVIDEICPQSPYNSAYEMAYAYMLNASIYEMNNCRDENKICAFYNQFRHRLQNESNLHFHNKKYETIIYFWNKLEYDSNWFRWKDNYFEQLCICDCLRDAISKWDSRIILWGLGKRGKAFERWCIKNNITLNGIYDKNADKEREYDEYGYKIYDLNEIYGYEGLIVASNSDIYFETCNEFKNVVNLEIFCPI